MSAFRAQTIERARNPKAAWGEWNFDKAYVYKENNIVGHIVAKEFTLEAQYDTQKLCFVYFY